MGQGWGDFTQLKVGPDHESSCDDAGILPDPQIELARRLAQQLATRVATRTEATVHAQLHSFLTTAPLQLEDHHLRDIVLEQPSGAGQRHRIDVEVGQCVFEVKSDLRKGRVREEAIAQLSGYVGERSEETGQRYVGVLTDGCEWHLYRLQGSALTLVSTHEVSADQPSLDELCVWLEGVLATGAQLSPTPLEIEQRLGAQSPGHSLDIADLSELYEENRDVPAIRLKRELWAKLLTTALGTAFRDDDKLFVQHTLLVVTAEVIAHAVLDIDPRDIPPIALVTGQQFRRAKVLGVVESDFFDWVAEVPRGDRFVRNLARRLSRFAWAHVEHDVLKVLYESVISTQQRKQLGEYYTPDWLAEHVVKETVDDALAARVLDPSCGSGTFIFYAVRRFLSAADAAGLKNQEALERVCSQVMGVDLHPVAVTLARVTYLLAMGAERLKHERGPIAVPIFLGDSLQWGQEETLQSHGALDLARPHWLASEPNRVDVLIGNPPWLSYRYMTPMMQTDFRRLLKDRDLWAGAKSVTHIDLSSVFVVRSIERYLKFDGSFAFVMPYAVLSRQHFARFRSGVWRRPQGLPVCASFDEPWDFHRVKPPFFEVPCCVIRGRRVKEENGRTVTHLFARSWAGRTPAKNLTWEQAQPFLKSSATPLTEASTEAPRSPYAARFAQGGSLVPRMLCFVEELSPGPLGHAAGELRVRSRRSAVEKRPWKDLPAMEGTVESNFVMPVHVGDTILPYRPLEPLRAVIPWDGQRLLHRGEDLLSKYPGLSDWWGRVEATWRKNRSSDRLELIEQFDYRGKLRSQFTADGLCPPIRVVYSKSGMYLAAAVITDPAAVIDHQLYWASCSTRAEAHYLAAVLNSARVTAAVRKYQARGEHNPRHFDMYVWQLPIPAFDRANALHSRLAALGAEAAKFAAALDLPRTRFEKQRRFVRERLAEDELGKEIERAVKELL